MSDDNNNDSDVEQIENESASQSWKDSLVKSCIKWLPVWLPVSFLYVFLGLLGILPFPAIPDIVTVVMLCAVGVVVLFGFPYGAWVIWRTESWDANVVHKVVDDVGPDTVPVKTWKGGDGLADELETLEGSCETYLDGRTSITIARDFNPQEGTLIGTWRGAVTPREVLASASNIKRYREQIEPLAEYGFDKKINEVHDALEYERSYHLKLAQRDLEGSALAPEVFDDDELARLLGHEMDEETSVDDSGKAEVSEGGDGLDALSEPSVASDGVAVTDGGDDL